jgi:hypothetical protein
MTEFTSKWQKFSPEGSGIAVSKVAKAPSDTFDTSIAEGLSQKNFTACTGPQPNDPACNNAYVDHLLSRLRAGSQWLTAQHQAWLDSKPDAASDERFSVALAAWGEMERSLRLVFGYEGCVFGPDQRCPYDAPVICDSCVVALR